MQHGRKADNRRGAADFIAHAVLRCVYVADDLGERPVVTDGARQHIRDAVFLAAADDAVFRFLILQKLGNSTVSANPVDGIQMVVVPVRLQGLRIDVLPQRCLQIGRLEVVRCKCIPCEEGMDITVRNQFGKGLSRIVVESEGRTGNPNDFPVLTVMAQDFIKFVVIP